MDTTDHRRMTTPFGAQSTAAEVAEGITLAGKRVVVTGAATLPLVVLTFRYDDLANGTDTARYTAVLESDGRLVGEVVYDLALGGRTDSLTFVKQ